MVILSALGISLSVLKKELSTLNMVFQKLVHSSLKESIEARRFCPHTWQNLAPSGNIELQLKQ